MSMVVAGTQVRLVDPRVRQHKTEPVLDDDDSGYGAQDPGRFPEDEFDQAWILVAFCRQPDGFGPRLDACQVDDPAFRFGDDLLRDDEHVAGAQLEARLTHRFGDQGGKVVARLDFGQARYGLDVQHGVGRRRRFEAEGYPPPWGECGARCDRARIVFRAYG